jgi:hypothetical protein
MPISIKMTLQVELLSYPPWRDIAPASQFLGRPSSRFIFVTRRTGVWDLLLVRHLRCYEPEGVAANVNVGDVLFDFRHMTGDTFATCTTGFVVCMFFDAAQMWSVG